VVVLIQSRFGPLHFACRFGKSSVYRFGRNLVDFGVCMVTVWASLEIMQRPDEHTKIDFYFYCISIWVRFQN